MAGRWIIWTIGAVAVKLPLFYPGHEDMPVMRGSLESWIEWDDPGGMGGICMVKEDDLHPGRIG
jgi:hypothetical protein